MRNHMNRISLQKCYGMTFHEPEECIKMFRFDLSQTRLLIMTVIVWIDLN